MVYFWYGVDLDDFLIQNLNVHSASGFSTAVIILAILSVFYEAIRFLRDLLMDKFIQSSRTNLKEINGSVQIKSEENVTSLCTSQHVSQNINRVAGNGVEIGMIDLQNSANVQIGKIQKVGRSSMTTFKRYLHLVVSTMLHMIHTFLGFTLMMAIMTFNIWILTAVAFGTGMGYFIFNYLKRRFDQVKEIAVVCS